MLEHLVATARQTGSHLDATVHCVFGEPNHVHVLVSWRHDREWESMRSGVRSALSRAMNERFGRRQWFSRGSSRKRVIEQEHFDYLIRVYRKKHSGPQWVREEDRPRDEAGGDTSP